MSTEKDTPGIDSAHAEVLWRGAEQFIERAAAEDEQAELLAARWPTPVEQAALRHLAESLAVDARPSVRRVVAQLLSELPPLSERGVEQLLVLAGDADVDVRVEALSALGSAREFAPAVVPRLTASLADVELAVRQAAIWSLQDLGAAARLAIPVLCSIAEDKSNPIRQLAIDALPWIDAHDAALIKLFAAGLDDVEPGVRAASASSLGISAPQGDSIPDTLAGHLSDPEYEVAYFCVWSLGKYGPAAEQYAPAVLHRLKTLDWVKPDGSDLRSTLRRILAPIPKDEQLDDFRMQFFSYVFHPAATKDMAWIERIANHPWYLRIQRARFPHPSTREERLRLSDWMVEAKTEFAQRLWKNPFLGLTPERYRELPGFVKKHCLKIATRIMKASASLPATLQFDPPSATTTPSDEVARLDEVAVIQAILTAELNPIEFAVIHCLYRDGCTIAKTAVQVGLTESQVRTCEEIALSRLRRRLGFLK